MSTDLLEATPKESATKVMSLKERLLSIPRGEPRPVDMSKFPGWPQGELFVRPPTAAAIAAWEADGLSFDSKGRPTVKVSRTRKAKLVQITLCDRGGNLIFSNSDVEQIAQLDAPIVNHWYDYALEAAGQRRGDDTDDGEDEDLGN